MVASKLMVKIIAATGLSQDIPQMGMMLCCPEPAYGIRNRVPTGIVRHIRVVYSLKG